MAVLHSLLCLAMLAAPAHGAALGLREFGSPLNGIAGGGNGGNAGGVVPAGGLFYVHKIDPDLALGFSAGSYLGLGIEFDDDWAGRYHVTKGEFERNAVHFFNLNARWRL